MVVWAADKEYPELCEKLRNGLRSVTDPEIGMDVIQLGLVRNVQIDDTGALITAILTTPFCPYGSAMLESIRSTVENILNKPTRIEYGSEAWDMGMMDGAAEGQKDGFDWSWFS
jgi:metal-sulfur cluster biosynthetic enzyme